MVAMLITLATMFALLSAVQVATEINFKNQQREEAIQIATAEMMRLKATPFASISANYTMKPVPTSLRGATNAPRYRVMRSSWDISNVSSTSKVVDVRVRWVFKNTSTSYEVQSVVHQ